MSLIKDYLDKTGSPPGRRETGPVPPLLCRETKSPGGVLKRYAVAIPLACAVFLVSGYAMNLIFSGAVADTNQNRIKQVTADSEPVREKALSEAAGIQMIRPDEPLLPPVKVQAEPHAGQKLQQFAVSGTQDQPAKRKPVPGQEPAVPARGCTYAAASSRVLPAALPSPPDPKIPAATGISPNTVRAAVDSVKAKPVLRQVTVKKTAIDTPGNKSPAAQKEKKSSETAPTSEAYFNLGLGAQNAGDGKAALLYYRKALLQDPDSPRVLLNLSALHMKNGNLRRAAAILEKLHILEPDSFEALTNLGIVHTRNKDFDRAVPLFERALEIRPGDPDTLFNLAYLFWEQGRTGPARTLLEQITLIDKDHTRALIALAAILEKEKKYPAAATVYIKALNTDQARQSGVFKRKIESRIRLLQRLDAVNDQ